MNKLFSTENYKSYWNALTPANRDGRPITFVLEKLDSYWDEDLTRSDFCSSTLLGVGGVAALSSDRSSSFLLASTFPRYAFNLPTQSVCYALSLHFQRKDLKKTKLLQQSTWLQTQLCTFSLWKQTRLAEFKGFSKEIIWTKKVIC